MNSLLSPSIRFLSLIRKIVISLFLVSTNLNSEPLTGLVVDNTFTLAGNRFYHCFAKEWFLKGSKLTSNIIVIEKVSPRYGNSISISNQNKTLHEVNLPPRTFDYQELCQQTRQIANQKLTIFKLTENRI